MAKSGKDIFRPRARIIKTIGEELISNDFIAIVELIKNSYDADASKVEVEFEGEIEKGQGKIIIKDNGHGMDLETLRTGWMEPATILKIGNIKSKKGRRFLGEKGVGRFASSKLSKKLKIISKKKDNEEVKAFFEWDQFNQEDKYLDEIFCKWESSSENNFMTDQGTVLELSMLNSEWDSNKLAELKTHLSRLLNPITPVKDFKIFLRLPNKFAGFEGEVTPPESLNYPTYSIKGEMDNSGKLKALYIGSDDNQEQFEKEIVLESGFNPSCGGFEFEFRVWDRDSDSMKIWASKLGTNLSNIKEDLNSAAGVSIYRDGFRLHPYGDPKLDWIRLDMRRVQNPSMRLSNNQIVGYVLIEMEKNPGLKDQSNREGIVEGKALDDFKEAIKNILEEIESRRFKERRSKEATLQKQPNIFTDINIDPVIELVQRKLGKDAEAIVTLARTKEKIEESIRKVQEVLSRYRRLSTLGQLVDSVLHDGNSYLSKTKNEIEIITRELKKENVDITKLRKSFDLIQNEREAISNLFIRLEPFSGRRSKTKRKIILEDSIKNVFNLFEKEINKQNIRVDLPNTSTELKISDQDFQVIILNLLENSLYWLGQVVNPEKKIGLTISVEDEKLILYFSDNGPGIKKEDVPYIFDPYFTRKPEGIGLGLTIVGELCTEMGGTLELIKDIDQEFMTQFRITFLLKNGD